MEAIMIALSLLAAVLAYVCCRASGNGDDMAETCMRVTHVDPRNGKHAIRCRYAARSDGGGMLVMKTPEEIKKGLECCAYLGRCSEGCPYQVYVEGSFGCDELGCEDGLLPDALACIQQLEAKVPKWISVKESLPEKNRRVLGVCCMGVFEMWHDGKYWRIDELPFEDTVTHWMPLPEPPVEV